MRIGIIMGGISTEREVSLKSGEEIFNNINRNKYESIKPIVINNEDDVHEKIKNIDFALLALHGKFGEDGTIQKLLEEKNIRYSGCGVETSSICMNKSLTKKIIDRNGLPTAPWITVKSVEDIDFKKLKKIGYPLFIKPNFGGSSVATFFVKSEKEVLYAVKEGLKYDTEIIIEKYIEGEEVASFILDGEVYPTISIKASKGEFFDYASKYDKNGAIEKEAKLNLELQKKINYISRRVWDVLGCKGYSRIDMIISNNVPYVLEVNTLPGMTKSSLIPKSAKAKGMEYDELIDNIIKCSLN